LAKAERGCDWSEQQKRHGTQGHAQAETHIDHEAGNLHPVTSQETGKIPLLSVETRTPILAMPFRLERKSADRLRQFGYSRGLRRTAGRGMGRA
jgi:hypothetical protein